MPESRRNNMLNNMATLPEKAGKTKKSKMINRSFLGFFCDNRVFESYD